MELRINPENKGIIAWGIRTHMKLADNSVINVAIMRRQLYIMAETLQKMRGVRQ
jgi:hypothetical protein